MNEMTIRLDRNGAAAVPGGQLLLTLFENAAYKTDTMQPTLNALRAEWGGSAQDVPVQSVSLSSTTMTLSEGESKTLTNEAVDGATLTPNITDNVYGGTRGCISTVVTNSTALAKAD